MQLFSRARVIQKIAIMATSEETNRIPTISEDDLLQLIDNIDSKNTKEVIAFSIRVVRSYCTEKDNDFDAILTKPKDELVQFLRSFYAEVRQGNGACGSYYAKRSAITTIRLGLFDILK